MQALHWFLQHTRGKPLELVEDDRCCEYVCWSGVNNDWEIFQDEVSLGTFKGTLPEAVIAAVGSPLGLLPENITYKPAKWGDK
jgi:hypothetical protein